MLQRTCPPDAQAARLGGDEFVVMLPGTDADEAFEATDRLRRELGAGLDEAGFPLRLSAGISTYPYDGAAATQLLRAADQALYHAKARGKNQVVGFREILRGASPTELPPARSDRSRSGSGADGSVLVGAMDAAGAIWAEQSVADVWSGSARRSLSSSAQRPPTFPGSKGLGSPTRPSTPCGTSILVRTTRI